MSLVKNKKVKEFFDSKESNSFVAILENDKGKIKKILETYPETRDNDNLLILKVWSNQKPELRSKYFCFIDFANDFLDNKFTSTSSIIRNRAKLQEEIPELRGKKYVERIKIGRQTSKNIKKK